tara:strand:+ start:4236 stop:6782 length:2547 start_codon:yes stop_codon:yes gene_type:complete
MTSQKLVNWEPEYYKENIKEHPIKICQTVSMSCVPTVNITCEIENDYENNLSTFQLETILKIKECLKKNKPFLLGDGTGTGKGRILAAVVRETGLKTLWISSSLKLEKSAKLELELVFGGKNNHNVKFASYTSVKYKFKDIVDFLKDEECLIILDECHQMRNCSSTKKIIDKLLNMTTKICYSSATIASSIKHLLYLNKMDLWGSKTSPFDTWEKIENAAKSDSAGLLELISLHFCRNGQYVCRQLDTKDVKFIIKTSSLTKEDELIYKKCSEGLFNMNGKNRQQFFLRLIVYFKVKEAINTIEEYLEKGKSVVVSVSNTGAATLKRSKENGNNITYFQEICDEYGIDLDFEKEPIDSIISHFGKNNVSEITGRGLRPSSVKNKYERIPKDDIENFKTNKKRIAILSRAGGMGLSLHDSDGKHPRVHIILEIPWSGEDFLQQMGRIYRSNAHTLPEYVFLVSDIPSEYRMIMSIIKKLKNMGAIVKADRTAYEIPGLKEENHWSSKLKGDVGLQLAIASRISQVNECDKILDVTYPKSMSLLRNSIIRNLCVNEEDTLESEEIWSYNMMLAKDFFPSLYYPVTRKWSVQNHSLFGNSLKKRSICFLMCAKASNGPLGTLPENILLYIIELMASIQSEEVLKEVSKWTHIKYSDFSSCLTERIMNDALCMPVNIQNMYIDLFNSHYFKDKKLEKIKTINQYAKDLVGSSHINCTVKYCKKTDYKFSNYKLKIKYDLKKYPDPPPNAEFWQSFNGKRVIWKTKNGECTSFDGGNVIFDEYNFQMCGSEKWERCVKKQEERLQRICNQTPTTFYVATENALLLWSSSLKKTVHFADDCGNNLVGVLVEIAP